MSAPGAKIGQIFYASWGYDQTNIYFLKVVGLTPSGKTATCQMMSSEQAGDSSHVIPKDVYGETFRLRVKGNGDHLRLVGTYPFCRGGKRFGYFWVWKEKPVYETPPGFGH